MTLNRTNSLLLVLLIIVAATSLATRVDYSQPNVEVLPDMKYTPAWTAYASNSVFANGRTLQAPVRGTIARGQMPLHFEATKEDAIRAGEEILNPYQTDSSDDSAAKLRESIVRGTEAYRVFCTCCHGPTGAGDGPVTKRGFPPPPSLLTGKSKEMKDGQLFHVLTYGQASMPDFRGQLSSDRRWDLVNYIRGVQANTPEGQTVTEAVIIDESKTGATSTNNSNPERE
jgi:mono/diheme cytochrome c family protein